MKRPCYCCVGRNISGGTHPRSLARRGRLSRLLQFKHNEGYLYRFQNKEKKTIRERKEKGRTNGIKRERRARTGSVRGGRACEGGNGMIGIVCIEEVNENAVRENACKRKSEKRGERERE